jgi:hypothetical protein
MRSRLGDQIGPIRVKLSVVKRCSAPRARSRVQRTPPPVEPRSKASSFSSGESVRARCRSPHATPRRRAVGDADSVPGLRQGVQLAQSTCAHRGGACSRSGGTCCLPKKPVLAKSKNMLLGCKKSPRARARLRCPGRSPTIARGCYSGLAGSPLSPAQSVRFLANATLPQISIFDFRR